MNQIHINQIIDDTIDWASITPAGKDPQSLARVHAAAGETVRPLGVTDEEWRRALDLRSQWEFEAEEASENERATRREVFRSRICTRAAVGEISEAECDFALRERDLRAAFEAVEDRAWEGSFFNHPFVVPIMWDCGEDLLGKMFALHDGRLAIVINHGAALVLAEGLQPYDEV